MIRLYHYPLSPFCRKVRLTLAEKRIEVDLVIEPYWQKGADFVRRNPAAQVPILRTELGTFCESQSICEYVDEVRRDPPLMPEDALGRAEVRRLCGWFDDKFHREVTSRLLHERLMKKVIARDSGVREDAYPDGRAIKRAAGAIKQHLDYMTHLLEHRRWLAGETMTLADFAAAAHLSCLDYISDVDWNRSEIVRTWYATLKSRPSFRGLLADQIPGFPQPAHYADLDF
jgi:glutathione S-transferase